jgi:hypothetical protein
MIVEKLLENDYLLFLTPKLRNVEKAKMDEKVKKMHFFEHIVKFNMKALTSLIIEKEEYL